MCLICQEWEREKLTAKEAMRNIGEALMGAKEEEKQHLIDLSGRIIDKEVPSVVTEPEKDLDWWDENFGDIT